MGTRVRVLGNADVPAALQLLRPDPIAHLFVRSRIATLGLDRMRLGCDVLGLERGGQLVALLHHGSNLVPVGDPEHLTSFVEPLGARRHTSSIMGRADMALPMFQMLSERYGPSWSAARDERPNQPLMVIDTEPTVPGEGQVRQIRMDEFEPYFEAAVKMYTEEVGVSPLDPSGGYRAHVRRIIADGHAFGILQNGRVLFKSDIGTAYGTICQIQGVWLDPSLRGHGLSIPAMAQVVTLARRRYPVVSLYVNDFNVRARKLYERIGFATTDTLATILY